MNDIRLLELEFELEKLRSELAGVRHARGAQQLHIKQRALEIRRFEDAIKIQLAKEDELENKIKGMETTLEDEQNNSGAK